MKSARTNTEIQSRRRDLLKAFAGAPLLPLTLTVSGLLPAYATVSSRKGFTAATFSHMPAPSLENPAAMAATTVQSYLEVIFDDGARQSYALAYQPFFMTGDMVPDGKGGRILAGGCYDIDNQPIIDHSLPGKERHFFSNCPDGSSLLTVKGAQVVGVKGNTVFAVVQFEHTTRDQQQADMERRLPAPVAVLTLDQDPQTGQLTLVKYHNVDTSPVNGLWVTCGASLSPWNTHLSSEEYEPDAAAIADDARFQAFSRNLFGDAAKANPYHYGHLPEITVHADGSGSVVKHYCLGRISHELVQVMPDRRTVLMG
ncbi:MAG TPA: alkaline phosphatase PhoX, partial [Herbaspirillum sp.]|nr:alkaline phosphatase PhoX [Herbaspirillum sp.]